MTSKLTNEELQQRVLELEKELGDNINQNSSDKLNHRYLEAILNNTNLPIYLKDSEYNYIFINSQYERLAHVKNDEIQGEDDFAIFPKLFHLEI